MSIKKRTLSGLIWIFAEQIGSKLIQFIIGIILARLLSPTEFGLIGMLMIFISVSEGISSGGFIQALIRKGKVTETDYNTTFFYNFFVAIILFAILYLVSPFIANFYNETQLTDLLRFLLIIIIIDSFSFVQRAKIYKRQDFKLFAKSSFISQIVSGIIGISMALKGYGPWSLVVKMVVSHFLNALILIVLNRWVPKLHFSLNSFKELFSFGARILASQIIERIYNNIYLVVIGKFFNSADLGYYTRANMFKNLVSEQLTSSIQKVSLPLMSDIQSEEERLKLIFHKLVKTVLFISCFFLVGLATVSENLILSLLGEKWIESIRYLQVLSVSAILYPVSEININMLQVKGRADLILKLQAVRKLFSIPILFVSVMWGIDGLLAGILIISLINFFSSCYYSGIFIGLSGWSQFTYSLSALLLFGLVGVLSVLIGRWLTELGAMFVLVIQSGVYFSASIVLLELIQKTEYLEIKGLVYEYFPIIKKPNV